MKDGSATLSEPLHVVDIGASGGIDARWRKLRQPVQAILFEPDPREYEKLSSILGDNYTLLNAALSEHPGEIEFHLYKDQKASSVYLPDREILGRYYVDMGKFEIIESIKLIADTLDNQLGSLHLTDIDFIKIDVQGHELPIMKGGVNTLKNVVGLEVEVEFLPVYRGQPLFYEVDAFLRNEGFELFDLNRTYRNRCHKLAYGQRKGQLLWGDALYFKSPEQILSDPTLSTGKVVRAIQVYLAYNYPDVAETLYDMAIDVGRLPIEVRGAIEGWLGEYKVTRLNALPDFKGKGRVRQVLSLLADLFTTKKPTERHRDQHLGNPV